MPFTREELAAYEAAETAAAAAPVVTAASATEPEFDPATPASETAPAEPEAESSTAEDTVQPEAGDDDSSAETADSATAPADSESDTAAVADEGEGDDAPAPPRKGSAAERIQDLIAERDALRKFGDHVLAKLKEATQPTAAPPAAEPASAPATAAVADDPAPKLEDFNYDTAAFSKATTEWLDKQVKKQVDERVKQATAQVAAQLTAQQVAERYNERAEKFAESTPDFQVVISNPNLPQLAAGAANAIVRNESGPAIVYHLAKNPDVAARISRLDPDSQVLAIGRLVEKLTASKPAPAAEAPKPKPKPKIVTGAPPPPKPIPAGSNTAERNVLDRSLSMDDWVAEERNKKIAQREQRRQLRDRMR